MPEYWVVKNDRQDNCFTIYSSEARADQAVQLMRKRHGAFADDFGPSVIGAMQEGRAFGEGVLRDGLEEHEEDMILPTDTTPSSPRSSCTSSEGDPWEWPNVDIKKCMAMEGDAHQRCMRAMEGITSKLHYDCNVRSFSRMEIEGDIWEMLNWLLVGIDPNYKPTDTAPSSPRSSCTSSNADPWEWPNVDIKKCMAMEGDAHQRCVRAMEGITSNLHEDCHVHGISRMEIEGDIWEILNWLLVGIDPDYEPSLTS